MNSEAKLYELSYIFNAESEEVTDSINELARTYIESGKGMVLEGGRPTRRHLAYPIQKKSEAYMGYIKFYLPPADIKGLGERVGREKSVMRFIIAHSHRPEVMAPKPRRETLRPQRQEEKPAADIASIDKKLEEILGK